MIDYELLDLVRATREANQSRTNYRALARELAAALVESKAFITGAFGPSNGGLVEATLRDTGIASALAHARAAGVIP